MKKKHLHKQLGCHIWLGCCSNQITPKEPWWKYHTAAHVIVCKKTPFNSSRIKTPCPKNLPLEVPIHEFCKSLPLIQTRNCRLTSQNHFSFLTCGAYTLESLIHVFFNFVNFLYKNKTFNFYTLIRISSIKNKYFGIKWRFCVTLIKSRVSGSSLCPWMMLTTIRL